MIAVDLAVAVGLLLANGFFVAVEFSVLASRRTKLESMADAGSRRARVALGEMRHLNRQLAGAQLGITLASLLLGYVAEPTVAGLLEDAIHSVIEVPDALLRTIGFAAALTIVVFLHMVVGEMVPKNIAIAAPERTLLAVSVPNQAYVWLVTPALALLNGMANGIVRLFGVEPKDEIGTAATADELAAMLGESREEGLIEDVAHQLLTGALDLVDRSLGSVMVPRDEVETISRGATPAEAEAAVVRSGRTRLVVVGSGLDDVLGFVHAKDLLTIPAGGRERPLPLGRVRRMLVLDRRLPLDEALVAMQRARIHMAVVVDGSDRTAGIATLEDVIEALLGDLRDGPSRRGTDA